MVECTALEMRHTGNRIGGSNPSLSAKLYYGKPVSGIAPFVGGVRPPMQCRAERFAEAA